MAMLSIEFDTFIKVILLLTAAVGVCTVGGLCLFLRFHSKKNNLHKKDNRLIETRQRASWAWAVIVSVKGNSVSGSAFVKTVLGLEVIPANGAPYQASTVWLTDPSAFRGLQEGKEIQIKIDENDPSRIYPSGPWAEYLIAE